jgi:hypothetical protein
VASGNTVHCPAGPGPLEGQALLVSSSQGSLLLHPTTPQCPYLDISVLNCLFPRLVSMGGCGGRCQMGSAVLDPSPSWLATLVSIRVGVRFVPDPWARAGLRDSTFPLSRSCPLEGYMDVLFLFFFILFWQWWGLNSGPCAFWTGALPLLSHTPTPAAGHFCG